MSTNSGGVLPIHEASITTARLHLRPMRLSDAADMHEIRSDWECMKWSTSPLSTSLAMTEAWLRDKCLPDRLQRANFAIELLDSDRDEAGEGRKVMGGLGVARCPEIGYILNRAYHGHGYATEALQAFLELFWRCVPAHAMAISSEASTHQAQEVPAPVAPAEKANTYPVEMLLASGDKSLNEKVATVEEPKSLRDGWDFVEAIIDPDNIASAKVLVKANFTPWLSKRDDFESVNLGLRGTAIYRLARPGTKLGPPPGLFEIDMEEKIGIKNA